MNGMRAAGMRTTCKKAEAKIVLIKAKGRGMVGVAMMVTDTMVDNRWHTQSKKRWRGVLEKRN